MRLILHVMWLRPLQSPFFPYTTLFRSALPLPRPSRATGRRALQAAFAPAAKHVRIDVCPAAYCRRVAQPADRKSTRLNSSHLVISYAVFCLNKKHSGCTPAAQVDTATT